MSPVIIYWLNLEKFPWAPVHVIQSLPRPRCWLSEVPGKSKPLPFWWPGLVLSLHEQYLIQNDARISVTVWVKLGKRAKFYATCWFQTEFLFKRQLKSSSILFGLICAFLFIKARTDITDLLLKHVSRYKSDALVFNEGLVPGMRFTSANLG